MNKKEMRTHDIPKPEVIDLLNNYLCDLHIAYTKIHNYHWNVKGDDFFDIHEKTEEMYTSVQKEIDEVAERILQIGGRPLATVADYLENAKIEEAANESIEGQEVAENLLMDCEYIIMNIKDIVETAEDNNDPATADMMNEYLQGYEKHAWMLRAFADKSFVFEEEKTNERRKKAQSKSSSAGAKKSASTSSKNSQNKDDNSQNNGSKSTKSTANKDNKDSKNSQDEDDSSQK